MAQCKAYIHDGSLPSHTSQVRQCRRTATYYNPGGSLVVCGCHRRAWDLPIPKEAKAS